MDGYKKIIKSPTTRKNILKILRFIPDAMMLRIQYRIKLNRKLNLNNPKRFTEKIQCYKLNYHNPIMKKCVDKLEVRNYVKSKGLEEILVPLIAKYDKIEDIHWDELPNSFVMKTTNGGGGLNVFVCQNKQNENLGDIKEKFYLSDSVFKSKTGGREWAYYGLQRKIIVEDLLVDTANPELGVNDYKFFCFNGKAKYVVVDTDRYVGHKRNFYDLEWNNLNIESDCPKVNNELEKPKNFNKMIEIANILSSNFPFVRVDLYNVNGKIYFGELTFYPWSGYVQFQPDEFDFIMGKEFE